MSVCLFFPSAVCVTVSLSGVLYCLCSFVSLSLLIIFICQLIMGGQLWWALLFWQPVTVLFTAIIIIYFVYVHSWQINWLDWLDWILRRKTLAVSRNVFDRIWSLDGVRTLIKISVRDDLCSKVGIVWSTTTWTRESVIPLLSLSPLNVLTH